MNFFCPFCHGLRIENPLINAPACSCPPEPITWASNKTEPYKPLVLIWNDGAKQQAFESSDELIKFLKWNKL